MRDERIITMVIENQRTARLSLIISMVSSVAVIIGLILQFIGVGQSHESNTIALSGNSIAQTGLVLIEQSNGIQGNGVDIAKKNLDNDTRLSLLGMFDKLMDNRIYVCGSNLRSSRPDCMDWNIKPTPLETQQGLTGLAMVGEYLRQDVSKEAILPIFTLEMIRSLCNSSEITSLMIHNQEQSSAANKACSLIR